MNIFSCSGRLVRDCKVGSTAGDRPTSVCEFTLANDVGFGERKTTLYIECRIFGRRAESKLPEQLVKGRMVTVAGELTVEAYSGRGGEPRAATRLKVHDLDLGPMPQGGGTGSPPSRPAETSRQPEPKQDDFGDDNGIPF